MVVVVVEIAFMGINHFVYHHLILELLICGNFCLNVVGGSVMIRLVSVLELLDDQILLIFM